MSNPLARFFVIFAICSTAGLFIEPVSASVTGAACPSAISENDCVANDLQPTGSEVVNGPSACTEGEIFSATVRILFDEGGGANKRYNVGFYVGEAGESAIGGDSCTFDSLQPIGDPPFPLGGPFAELNGDFCGDMEKSEPTYKDIELLEIECKDDDGDGNVDISYVLTWENNANQASCSDPLDPLEFEPRPPKCLSDLEYDLPIAVEDPPSMDVAKGASPATLEEPGGSVRFPITIINTSPSVSDPLTIGLILDEVEGVVTDITGLTDCVVPFTLAPSQSRTCYYTDNVDGNAGDMITDTVTVLAQDDEGETVQDSDSTTVTIITKDLPPQPGDLRLVKFVSPSEIDEPGGTVQYDVLVANLSPTPVELTSLEDDLYGDLNGKGNCSVPQTLGGQNSIYFCAFEEQVSGKPGDVITDTITASGFDNLPTRTALIAKDSASVTIDDVPSDIEVTKVANTEFIPEPGGEVTFSLQIQNTSVTDVVTIDSLFDSQVGTPKGDCTTGFSLNPGEVYSCSYAGLVSGNAGDSVTNVILVRATDDDGVVLLDRDAATVVITGQLPDIEVRKIAVPQFIPLAGGTATYVVAIQNVSAANDPVKITSLVDEINGIELSLDGEGTCNLTDLILQPAPGDDSYYICSFTQTLPPGNVGDTVEDTVTAGGMDDEGLPAEASDNAIVTYVEVALPEAQLEIAKIVSPFELPEPGGDVTFSVFIANDSDPENPNLTLTLNALDDDIYGNLFSKGNCDLLDGITLAPQEIRNCSFTETLIGVGDEVKTDTIVATATDLLNRTVQASDSASVTILDLPASIRVIKTAYPNTVVEPGEDVTFSIRVLNTSQADVVVLDSLIDNVHGDLIAQGLCPPPGELQPGRDPYRCSFTAFVGGPPGFEERNTVTAFGTDEDGETIEDSDQASVTVLDQPPSITATKVAIPDIVPTQGDTVTFTVTTANTSRVDEVTLDTLQDSVFGDLTGQGDCSVPQVLPAGDSYTCSFDAFISGNDGETHANEFVVTGTSDDGDLVAANAQAIVTIPDQLPSIEVAKFAVPPFVPLAGGTVTYVVAIQNVSSANDPVTITKLVDLVDRIETSLDGQGSCDLNDLVLQPAPGDGSSYTCSFTQDLPPGSNGDTVEDMVTASGEDDEGDLTEASDNAIVRYLEAPPDAELEIAKFASPFEIQEPGGLVTFSVVVTNASDPALPSLTLTLTSLQDDIHGNLFSKGDCNLLNGITLSPEETANCSFTESVNGVGGDIETDTIIAMANDVLNRPARAIASASVTILDLPGSLLVSKTASPTTVVEPGDDVTFEIVVFNASQVDVIDMESLIDDVHGDLITQGLCPPPDSLLPAGDPYLCQFTVFVGGAAGFQETNTVTATGKDDNDNSVQASDQAFVTVLDQRASISVLKSATPEVIPAPGGNVTFSFTTTNTSRADTVILDTLLDSVFGDLNGQGDCSVPQPLEAGDSYTCSMDTQISGSAGEMHVNQIVVTGSSDNGDPVTANAIAIVSFTEPREITTLGSGALGVLILLLGMLGIIRIRNF